MMPVEKWSKGLVGSKPTPVSDLPQTGDKSFPELKTATMGGDDWNHSDAKGDL